MEVNLRYPFAIEPGTETTAFGVVVPDLPGCFSAGDTLDEAISNGEEAVSVWIDTALDTGDAIPAPSSMDAVSANPEFAGWIFGAVAVRQAAVELTPEEVADLVEAKAEVARGEFASEAGNA